MTSTAWFSERFFGDQRWLDVADWIVAQAGRPFLRRDLGESLRLGEGTVSRFLNEFKELGLVRDYPAASAAWKEKPLVQSLDEPLWLVVRAARILA